VVSDDSDQNFDGNGLRTGVVVTFQVVEWGPHTEVTSLAMTVMRIKQLAKRQWLWVLISATPAAILRNPSTYSAKFAWKTSKKLIIPMGTKREIASAFYQLKIGHGYNKVYLHCIDKVDSPNCSCGAKQTP
jgi:hypothetical protein